MGGESKSTWRQALDQSLPVLACLALAGVLYIGWHETSRRSRQQPAQALEHAPHQLAADVEDDEQAQVIQQLWRAALAGDCAAVSSLLHAHDIPPDTPHPMTGSQLVLAIAAVDVDDEHAQETADRLLPTDRDEFLQRVLQVLENHGWSMSVRHPATRENALHVLAGQPQQHLVTERMRFFVRWALSNHTDMLEARTAAGQLPEECVAHGELEGSTSVAVHRLRMARIQVSYIILP